MKRYLFPIIGIALLAVTVLEVNVGRASARPAQGRAEARPTSSTPRVAAEGRVVVYPGAEVSVGSDVAGTIASINVNEKDRVKKGDVIALIRADDTRAAYTQARSRVGEA